MVRRCLEKRNFLTAFQIWTKWILRYSFPFFKVKDESEGEWESVRSIYLNQGYSILTITKRKELTISVIKS